MNDPDGETPTIVPISINVVTSYFIYRKPTRSKFKDGDVPRIGFTENVPDWYLSDQYFADREGEMTDFR